MKDQPVTPEDLLNILHAQAVVDDRMEYCQGMNFLAGFLILVLKDQAMAFGILKQVVEKYEMTDIFNADKSKLKLFFYTLDRLISIYLPDLHSHFKEENINSSMFCTTFFITLFTQVLQTQQSPDKIWKLKRIWDYFIVYGWKAIFKVSVILLRESEENCLQMQFEVILS